HRPLGGEQAHPCTPDPMQVILTPGLKSGALVPPTRPVIYVSRHVHELAMFHQRHQSVPVDPADSELLTAEESALHGCVPGESAGNSGCFHLSRPALPAQQRSGPAALGGKEGICGEKSVEGAEKGVCERRSARLWPRERCQAARSQLLPA